MAIPFFSLLTVCGLGEIESHGTRGVTHVLSILDPETPEPDFGRYPPLTRTVLRFHDIVLPEAGKQMPRRADVDAVLAFGRAIADGSDPAGHLLVHCHAGISRSTAAMATLLAAADPALSEEAVLERVREIRPQAWPNLVMIEFADEALGRTGRLVAAAGRLYARRLAERPELGEWLAGFGRGPELALAGRSAGSVPVA